MNVNQETICNLALGNIGHKNRIASMQERSYEAAQCRSFYQPALLETLEQYDWDFARRYEALTAVSDEDVTGWEFAYAWPTLAIAIRRLEPQTKNGVNVLYETTTRKATTDKLIRCNLEAPVAVITIEVDQPQFFTPKFVTAMGMVLASYLALAIPRNVRMSDYWRKNAEVHVNRAEVSNANQNPEQYDDRIPEHIAARG